MEPAEVTLFSISILSFITILTKFELESLGYDSIREFLISFALITIEKNRIKTKFIFL